MNNTEEKVLPVPVNKPQMLYNIIMPHVGACVWSRYSGKSVGPVARFVFNNVLKMPRSNGFLQGVTYAQLVANTIPAMIEGLERLGFIENKHFWLYKRPDKILDIKKALRDPKDYDHYIKIYNGSGIYLVSEDVASSINGVRTQWGCVDEAKLINKKKFDDRTVPTMAGGDDLWGARAAKLYGKGRHLAEYLSLLFCTDMPTTSGARWILELEKLMDPALIDMVKSIHNEIRLEKIKLKTASEREIIRIRKRIDYLCYEHNELRRGLVYVSFANALDNIDFVGVEPLKAQKRILTDVGFRVYILNERLLKNEKGFYALLDPEIQGYSDMINYDHFDKLDKDVRVVKRRDCRWDADVDTNQPLTIAFDHNNKINCVATAQDNPVEARLLSTMCVEHPDMLDACVRKWDAYYKYHPVKEVYYIHDATSVGGGKNAMSNINFVDEVTRILTELNWSVNIVDIGQLGSHNSRFHFFGLLFKGKDPRLPKFRYNRTNCAIWETAALQAGLIKKGIEYAKDKSSENNDKTPPQEATHITEAVDILFYGKYRKRFSDESEYVGAMIV